MGLDLDLSGSFAFVSGTETVTYRRKLNEGTWDDPGVPVENCKRRAVQNDSITGQRFLGRETTYWHIWQSQFDPSGEAQPEIDDKIEDGRGIVWRVKGVERQSQGQRHRLLCVREE